MLVQAVAAQNNANVAQNAAVEQRVPKAWEGDHSFLVDFSAPSIHTTGDIQIESVGPGAMFNQTSPWNWLMRCYDSSYISINVNLTKKEAQKDWNLGLSQFASQGPAPNGQRGYSPISIEINGKTIEPRFLSQVNAWREDFFPVQLHEGENSIVIRLLDDATTNYCIQKLWLDPVSE